MKKVSFLNNLILSLVITTMLVACDKGLDFSKLDPFRFDEANPTTVKAQVYNGSKYNSKISTVRAVSDMSSTRSTQEMITLRAAPTGETVATTDWSGGNFTLTLPTTIDESKLRDSKDIIPSLFGQGIEYYYVWFSVKSYYIRLAAYDAAGNYFDDLVLYDSKADDDVWVYFLYVERDLPVWELGENPTPIKVFKKGWNIVYLASISAEKNVTYKPTSDLYWMLYRDLPYEYFIARD